MEFFTTNNIGPIWHRQLLAANSLGTTSNRNCGKYFLPFGCVVELQASSRLFDSTGGYLIRYWTCCCSIRAGQLGMVIPLILSMVICSSYRWSLTIFSLLNRYCNRPDAPDWRSIGLSAVKWTGPLNSTRSWLFCIDLIPLMVSGYSFLAYQFISAQKVCQFVNSKYRRCFNPLESRFLMTMVIFSIQKRTFQWEVPRISCSGPREARVEIMAKVIVSSSSVALFWE